MSNDCFFFKGAIAKRVNLVNFAFVDKITIPVDCRFGKFIVDVDLLCSLLAKSFPFCHPKLSFVATKLWRDELSYLVRGTICQPEQRLK